jgi:hypothetical protein
MIMKWKAVLAAGVLALAAPAMADDVTKDAASGGPLPANYREMFAQYIAAYYRAKPNFGVHDAFISKPFQKWGGLFHGGTMTTVCIQLTVENRILFGQISKADFFMTVKDGQVDDLAVGLDPCKDLSPFPELMRLIQR